MSTARMHARAQKKQAEQNGWLVWSSYTRNGDLVVWSATFRCARKRWKWRKGWPKMKAVPPQPMTRADMEAMDEAIHAPRTGTPVHVVLPYKPMEYTVL